jgi:hypothetical protein
MSGTWALGWATADVVSAAEFAKGVGCIYDTTLGAGAASIDVTGIVGVYAHLKIVAYLRSDTAAVGTDIIVRFNADSAANYTTVNATQTSINSNAAALMPAASHAANAFGAYEIVIPHYAGTANNKSANAVGATNTTSTTMGAAAFGGMWRSTAAITRITVSAAAGNIVTGSRLSIYAMGA